METLAIKALTGGGGSGGNLIDDTTTSTTKTWSSSKLNEDTTMIYAKISQKEVKTNHYKYLS